MSIALDLIIAAALAVPALTLHEYGRRLDRRERPDDADPDWAVHVGWVPRRGTDPENSQNGEGRP